MFKLLKYLKPYRLQSILGPFFKLIEVLFELAVPIIVAMLIDNGIAAGDKPYIFKMCGILALIAALGLISAVTAQYFAAKAATGFAAEVRKQLFTHIQKLSYSQQDRIGASTLITRLTGDVNQVQSGVNLTLRLLLRSPFVVFGAVIMAFRVDSKAALVFAVTVPILAAVIFTVMLITVPLYRRVQIKLDGVLGKTEENLRGTRIIRAFCKENDEIDGFGKSNGALTAMQIKVGKISAFMNPVTFVIINLAIAAVIYTGALRVESGALTSGSVVALYNYMTQILVELIKLASLIITVTKAIASGNRIQTVLDTKPETVSGGAHPDTANGYAVEFNGVSLAYSTNADRALKNINLQIKKGETLGIIGSTGSGKSSLINLIPRFYDATDGEITVTGCNVKEYDTDFLRDKIGVVPQKNALFYGTVRDNIRMGRDISDSNIWTALETAQAKQMIEEKDGGLDFVIEQEGRNLSGGQKQRLCIARAVARKPEILILDDSSSALDYATGAALSKALKSTDFSPTVIIVSQRIAAIADADRIAVLDEGELAGIGTAEELLESSPVYREIYTSQTKEDS